MSQYIEDKEVMTVTILEDEKTPSGNEMVSVAYSDGTNEVMPKKRLELTSTDEVSDATSVREVLVVRVSAICFGMLHEYGIKRGEVNNVIDGVVMLINKGFEKAQEIKWGFESEAIPLMEVDKVLTEDVQTEKNNNDGSEVTGSGPDSENKE